MDVLIRSCVSKSRDKAGPAYSRHRVLFVAHHTSTSSSTPRDLLFLLTPQNEASGYRAPRFHWWTRSAPHHRARPPAPRAKAIRSKDQRLRKTAIRSESGEKARKYIESASIRWVLRNAPTGLCTQPDITTSSRRRSFPPSELYELYYNIDTSWLS